MKEELEDIFKIIKELQNKIKKLNKIHRSPFLGAALIKITMGKMQLEKIQID